MSNSKVPIEKLKALGFQTYAEYLASPHWKDLRLRFVRSGLPHTTEYGDLVCMGCGRFTRLDLHHKTYKRFGAEWLMDLILLCRDCHEGSHEAHRNNRRDGLWRATRKAIKKRRTALRGSGPAIPGKWQNYTRSNHSKPN